LSSPKRQDEGVRATVALTEGVRGDDWCILCQSVNSFTGFSARLQEGLRGRYAAIGEIDKAFEWLDKAYEARSAGMIYFAVEPAYEALRVDPRFDAMVRKVGPVAQMPLQETSDA